MGHAGRRGAGLSESVRGAVRKERLLVVKSPLAPCSENCAPECDSPLQNQENHNWLWILYLFCLIFVLAFVLQIFKIILWHPFIDTEELQARGRSRVDAEIGTLKKEIEELRAKYAPCEKQIAQCQKQLEEIQAQGRAGEDAKKGTLKKEIEELRAKYAPCEKQIAQCQKQLEEIQAQGRAGEDAEKEELRAKYEELQARGRSRVDAEIGTLKKEIEELRAKSVILEKENEELRAKSGTLKNEIELLRVQRHKVDVTLDADTAHPRLQVSEDGKSVTDTGVIRKVPDKDERFDSHTFLLAKEGYRSGRHYWEVDVGKKRNWNLGVAQETVRRKETVALSPKNGFWVIGLADGQEYWALSDPWTRLMVSGRPQKIGIFLDISSKKLSFFSVHQKKLLYTFTSVNHHSRNVKLFPFFSTGSAATSSDTEPLRIAGGFDDDK
ncbi:E3 ubiquitin-protein ligase TRIM39-like isoform X3 [Gallus gallus]|uniref:E3 ubiquitin-protein ligase TRIM39-like isoform X3 n=1 Tax=Gallus gallus TaxID=9031 RepID=UPI001AE9217D|nr:E3 ubiquitin-protein ligase TRIM39-like isoform X3 [Gallus gallus]